METPPTYSQPPRYTVTGHRGPGIYYDFIAQAFQMIIKRPGVYVVGAVIVYGAIAIAYIGFLVTILASNRHLFDNPGRPPEISFGPLIGAYCGLGIVGFFVRGLCFGFTSCAIEEADTGTTSIRTLFSPFRRILHLFAIEFLCQFLMTVGMLACLVPGFYVAGILAFAPTLVVTEGLGPIEAMTRSFDMIRSHAWEMVGLIIVLGLIVSASGCVLLVGVLVGLPIYYVVLGLHYREFRGPINRGFVAPEI